MLSKLSLTVLLLFPIIDHVKLCQTQKVCGHCSFVSPYAAFVHLSILRIGSDLEFSEYEKGLVKLHEIWKAFQTQKGFGPGILATVH